MLHTGNFNVISMLFTRQVIKGKRAHWKLFSNQLLANSNSESTLPVSRAS